MEKASYLNIILIALLGLAIQFVFIFTSYGNGGLAMAPFAYVPLMVFEFILIFIINIIYAKIKKKYITANQNVFIFLSINFVFLLMRGWNIFQTLKSEEAQLMFYPSVISAFLYLYLKILKKYFFEK